MPLFGEIVEPVSRALYVDESSDEEYDNDADLSKLGKLQWIDEAPISFETLLLFHGQLACDFMNKILKEKNAGHLSHVSHFEKTGKENILIYKLSSGVYGCICPSVDIVNSNIVLNLLTPIFQLCKQILIVATLPAPFYKGNDPSLDLPSAFMRALYTSSYDSKDVIAPILESPNLVTGVPAAVLSWCEVFKKPSCLYVCFSDSPHLDSISAEPLVKVFTMFEGLLSNKVLSFQSGTQVPTSNLYM